MSAAGRTLQPWLHRSGTFAKPNAILVRLKLGETADRIPAAMDVRRKLVRAAETTEHGALDRVVKSFGGGIRVSRLHSAAAALRNVGDMHRGYSDLEEISGISRVLRFEVDPGTHVGSMAISLMQLDIVESALPDYLCAVGLDGPDRASILPGDPDGWSARDQINARAAMAHEPGDSAIVVGVVDSGVAHRHPEFAARRLRRGLDTVQLGSGELPGGVKLLGDNKGVDTNPDDAFVGHGSGCAGIIGAAGHNMPPGLAGACQVLPIRSLGAATFPGRPNAVGIGAVSDLDMGLVLAVQLGADVVNMSFGTDDEALEPGAPKPHSEAVAYATARGATLVAASGNSGDRRTYWPAAYPEVIAVGSVGADGRVSSFSTTGDHVSVCGPGERVRTATVDGYQNATGTSFAAPFVAATAALLLARAQNRSAPVSPVQIKRLIEASAASHHPDTPAGNGIGILDAARALQLLDAAIDADDSVQSEGADDG
ncbi:S8 family peptidase [Sphingopyxis fribergensis]